jgi:hypothetical protein
MTNGQERKTGFALLSKEARHAVAVKGGKANTNRNRWTSAEAKVYGKKGGRKGGKAPRRKK